VHPGRLRFLPRFKDRDTYARLLRGCDLQVLAPSSLLPSNPSLQIPLPSKFLPSSLCPVLPRSCFRVLLLSGSMCSLRTAHPRIGSRRIKGSRGLLQHRQAGTLQYVWQRHMSQGASLAVLQVVLVLLAALLLGGTCCFTWQLRGRIGAAGGCKQARHTCALPTRRHVLNQPMGACQVDTGIFNGQTTAADLLWAAVPIVTRASDRFVGRVGASLAAAMPRGVYVARNTADYLRLASALIVRAACREVGRKGGREGGEQARAHGSKWLRTHLAATRNSAPIFKAAAWRRRFVTGLALAWEAVLDHEREPERDSWPQQQPQLLRMPAGILVAGRPATLDHSLND